MFSDIFTKKHLYRIGVLAAASIFLFGFGNIKYPADYMSPGNQGGKIKCPPGIEMCNVAEATGLADAIEYGRGALFVDVDSDGWDDILDVNSFHNNEGSTVFYRNRGDRTFLPFDLNIGQYNSCLWFANAADFDNDGDPDLLTGGYNTCNLPTLTIYRNDLLSSGRFVDLGDQIGLTAEDRKTWWRGASWADYDLDGWLDFIAVDNVRQVQLYRNNSGRSFSNVTSTSGINVSRSGTTPGVSPVWLDYDLDGYPDLYVPGWLSHYLFRNDGKGGFVDVTSKIFVSGELTTSGIDYNKDGIPDPAVFTAASEDFNQDGRPDLYLGRSAYQDIVFINQRDDTFRGFGREAGIDTLLHPERSEDTMGLGVGDINEDGWPDVLIGTGDPQGAFHDIIFCNQGKSTSPAGIAFKRCSGPVIQGHGKTMTHGIAIADYDHDGDVDVFYNLGGSHLEDPKHGTDFRAKNAFYLREPFSQPNTATVHLVGTKSNRGAIGARFSVRGSETHYYFVRSTQGFHSQNSNWITVGLGDAAEGDITVDWPSGTKSKVKIKAGTRMVIKE